MPDEEERTRRKPDVCEVFIHAPLAEHIGAQYVARASPGIIDWSFYCATMFGIMFNNT